MKFQECFNWINEAKPIPLFKKWESDANNVIISLKFKFSGNCFNELNKFNESVKRQRQFN